jgi:hypothetical protein
VICLGYPGIATYPGVVWIGDGVNYNDIELVASTTCQESFIVQGETELNGIIYFPNLPVAPVGDEANTFYVCVDGNEGGQVMRTSTSIILSSIRFKENVHPIDQKCIEDYKKITPVTFNYISDSTKRMRYGFIAEDFVSVLPELVRYNAQGEVESLRYDLFYALLHRWLQDLEVTKNEQQDQIALLQEQVATQQETIEFLIKEVALLKALLLPDE